MNPQNYRLLVVEDNDSNLEMLTRRLQRVGYQVTGSNGGRSAMQTLAAQHHDLVLLDLMMPEVDGYAVLKHIHGEDRLRNIPVIMLTACSEREDVIRCLKLGAKDYIIKPYDLSVLCDRINRYLPAANSESIADQPHSDTGSNSSISLVSELAESLKSGKLEFPVLPAIGLKVAEIARSENADLAEITRVINLDPGLATKLISLSNSSAYRGRIRFTKVEEAVARIGLKETANQALLLTSSGMFKSDNPLFEKLLAELWTHSLATAVLSKIIGQHLGKSDPHQLFTMGLLHDIGQLVLLKVLIDLSKKRPMADEQAIHEVLETLHSEFGAAILKRWEFPQAFIDIARFHHRDRQLDNLAPEIVVVAIANKLAPHIINNALPAAGTEFEKLSYAKYLELRGDTIETITTAGKAELEKALSGLSECAN